MWTITSPRDVSHRRLGTGLLQPKVPQSGRESRALRDICHAVFTPILLVTYGTLIYTFSHKRRACGILSANIRVEAGRERHEHLTR